jgi:hypothetical protein
VSEVCAYTSTAAKIVCVGIAAFIIKKRKNIHLVRRFVMIRGLIQSMYSKRWGKNPVPRPASLATLHPALASTRVAHRILHQV